MISNSAKTIVCYGDSNTWGQVPRSDARYDRDIRWPSVLQNLLGGDFEIVNEGLCGRTLVAVDSAKIHRTGITHLRSILETSDPIDTIIIMLGTNDMKSTYGLEVTDIAKHLEETIAFIQSGPSDLERIPKILVICPPVVIRPKKDAVSEIGKELDARMARAIEMSVLLLGVYKKVCEKTGCDFINAGDYVSSSDVDGYHLSPESHVKLASVVATYLQGK